MDFFTETALIRSGAIGVGYAEGDAERRVAERAEEIELDARSQIARNPGPIAIEDRLALAYGSPVPLAISDFFIHWRRPPHQRWDKFQETQAARAIARAAQAAAVAARSRLKESAERLARLEVRLAEIEARHSSASAALERDPAPTADPLEVGQQSTIAQGCERLISVLRREIEAAERAGRESANWLVLENLAEVIAGFMRASDGLARDLGFAEAWQVAPPGTRKDREERRLKETERRRVEDERRWDETGLAEQAKRAAIAKIDSLDFVGLVSYLFFEERELALDDLKARVAEWDYRQLGMLKALIETWPEARDPDFLIAADRDVSGWMERRRLDPAWAPSTEEDLINHAARRLRGLVHPSPRAIDF
jgi:hypothetical protein